MSSGTKMSGPWIFFPCPLALPFLGKEMNSEPNVVMIQIIPTRTLLLLLPLPLAMLCLCCRRDWREPLEEGSMGVSGIPPPPMCVIMEASPCSQGSHGNDCCQPDCLFLQPSIPEAEGPILLRSFWHPDFLRTGHSPTRMSAVC